MESPTHRKGREAAVVDFGRGLRLHGRRKLRWCPTAANAEGAAACRQAKAECGKTLVGGTCGQTDDDATWGARYRRSSRPR
eukprot:13498598-Alexandrium_andersonii.AAC.1